MVEVRPTRAEHIFVYEQENKLKKSENKQSKTAIRMIDRCRDTFQFNAVDHSDDVHGLWECV